MTLITSGLMLTEEELKLTIDMADNPEMYRTHGLGEHNTLCKRNKRCILCLADSKLVFDVGEKEVKKDG